MPEVRTEVEISNWEGLLSLDRFLPTLQRFADIFDTNLVAHVPYTMAQPHEGDPSTIHIHFFYRATTGGVSESTTSSVFNYSSTRPLRCWVAPSLPGLKWKLKDFKGTLIAHRDDQHSIFIDFDFLQDSWTGQEDILALILWCLIPTRNFLKTGERLAKDLRERFHDASGAGEEETAAFSRFFLAALESAADSCLKEIDGAAAELVSAQKSFVDARRELQRLEEYLQWLSDKLPSDETLGKEFDAILRLQDIARIAISDDAEGTEDKGTIYVTTRRITQYVPPPPKPGEKFDIGSFIIHIMPFAEFCPQSVVSNAVRIVQKEKGRYVKQSIESNSCLGNKATTGLNYAAAGLFAEAAILPLTQLILTFLKFDTKKPTLPEETGISNRETKPPDLEAEFTEEESRQERERYIKFMKKVRHGRLSRITAQKCRDLNKKAASDLETFGKLVKRRDELKMFSRFLKEKFGLVKEAAPAVFRQIASHPYVLGVQMRMGLRVWLYGEDMLFPRLLWILPSGVMHLLTIEEDGFLGKTDSHGIIFSSQPDEEAVRKFLARGEYAEVLSPVINQIRRPPHAGWF